MSVQHKKNFPKLDNQDHILVKEGVATVAGRFLETRKARLRDGKVFFLFIRILFFSKNPTYFVIDPLVDKKEEPSIYKVFVWPTSKSRFTRGARNNCF